MDSETWLPQIRSPFKPHKSGVALEGFSGRVVGVCFSWDRGFKLKGVRP